MQKNRWWLAVPFALGVMIVNVLIHVVYMVIYSYLIDPGHDEAYYEAHALVSAPYSSIVAGTVLMFFAGRWVGSKFPPENSVKAALAVWLVYFVMDIAIVTAAGVFVSMGVVIAISLGTKLAGAWLGGRSAQIRAAKTDS
jgi:hypothetical protein